MNINSESPMSEVLAVFYPGAQRALFRKYQHRRMQQLRVFQPTETLGQVLRAETII